MSKQTSAHYWSWNNWYFRVLGKGFSVQPIEKVPIKHKHLFSVRHAKIRPLHIMNHCFRVLA